MDKHGNALVVRDVVHSYGQRRALDALSLSVATGELFALLGPNGSGKSTLFRLISTLVPVQQGEIQVFGLDTQTQQREVREQMGVVFQSPSLDPKLTVQENLWCGGVLYGLKGQVLRDRIDEVAERMRLAERMKDPVEQLSGGLQRRVELAKAILHRPRLLLMDEPSTGLDPAARLDLWHALRDLQAAVRVTVVLTTHLLDEADRADRVAILDNGTLSAIGPPGVLKSELGQQVFVVRPPSDAIFNWFAEREIEAKRVEGEIRVTGHDVANLVPALAANFGGQIEHISVGQPSLEDVFVARTGHRYWEQQEVATV